jgi:hypothetical protein
LDDSHSTQLTGPGEPPSRHLGFSCASPAKPGFFGCDTLVTFVFSFFQ